MALSLMAADSESKQPPVRTWDSSGLDRLLARKEEQMKIQVTIEYGHYDATDDDSYDGPGSPIGCGHSEYPARNVLTVLPALCEFPNKLKDEFGARGTGRNAAYVAEALNRDAGAFQCRARHAKDPPAHEIVDKLFLYLLASETSSRESLESNQIRIDGKTVRL